MNNRLLLPLAGFAAFTLSGTVTSLHAQTTPAQPTPDQTHPVPAPDTTQSTTRNGAPAATSMPAPAPAPVPLPNDPANPNNANQNAEPQNKPGTTQNGAPAATSMQPYGTSQRSPSGMPAYGTPAPAQTNSMPAPIQRVPPPAASTRQTTDQPATAYVPYGIPDEDKIKTHDGSAYIPLDSWVYPEITRLYSLGFASTLYLSMRPYTRQSLAHVLEATHDDIVDSGDEEAEQILAELERYLDTEPTDGLTPRGTVFGTETLYARAMGIQGQILNDSFHLGQTIANDYDRPYQAGFNSVVGFSELAEQGRFSFYFRGEYQHAASAAGYSQTLSSALSQGAAPPYVPEYTTGDGIPYSGYQLHQRTIPTGPIPAANPFRIQEATLSYFFLGHEISGGKSDAWMGPAQGGALAWSNNAQDIYSFRINRVNPLYIPGFSWLFGTIRYDFFYGDLKGHSYPNSPYVHSEMASLRPTDNFEFAFQRTVIFGGEGHVPVTLHTFLRSFFSTTDTADDPASKGNSSDPGARFSDFSFSWRLPYVRKYATLVLDSFSHDDVSPISAPRRAAYRTGVYFPQIPGIRKLDFRVEAVTTDPGVSRSVGGQFFYFETIQRQGYTNEGNIMGDWIGREAKGGQAWLTYHLSGDEWVQLEYLNKKTEKDFIPGAYDVASNTYGPGGTTQNQFKIDVVKRFDHDNLELHAWYQHEGWKAPIYLTGPQNNNVFTAQVTFFPALKKTGLKP